MKKLAVVSTVIGFSAAGVVSDALSFETGKVSESRNVLVSSSEEMKCGKKMKEMKEKIEQCRKMMKEASCGSKMKECKTLLKKKEGKCGSMMKTKQKAKEMACGQCGSKK